MPFHCIGWIYMYSIYADVFGDLKMHIFWGARSPILYMIFFLLLSVHLGVSLAHIIHDFFLLLSVHLGVLPPPPPIAKSWLRYCGRVTLPLVSNTLYLTTDHTVSPTPCILKSLYIWRLFGARVDVNSNLIMKHKKLYLVPKFPKVPTVGGDTPSHTLPIGV